jgi:excisionase family DNA binding protein
MSPEVGGAMSEPVVDDERIAYKVSHVAHLLECSRAHLYNLIARGELKSIKLGGARRITRAEIDRYLAEHAES